MGFVLSQIRVENNRDDNSFDNNSFDNNSRGDVSRDDNDSDCEATQGPIRTGDERQDCGPFTRVLQAATVRQSNQEEDD